MRRHGPCTTLRPKNCFNLTGKFISTFHEVFMQETSLVCTSTVPSHRQQEWLFKNCMSVLCNSKMDPSPMRILFVRAKCLNVSPIWTAPSSTCIAAINFNSFWPMSQSWCWNTPLTWIESISTKFYLSELICNRASIGNLTHLVNRFLQVTHSHIFDVHGLSRWHVARTARSFRIF